MHLHWDGNNDVGRRAQPERRARRRRDAGHRRSRGAQARARLDLDAAAAAVSRIAVDRAARRARRSRLPAALPRVPRRAPLPRRREGGARGRPGRGHRSQIGTDRAPARFVHRRRSRRTSTRSTRTRRIASRTSARRDGYANQPLDGIWLRGPYLHNGSVPTLRDLLEPPERRPAVFYRGYDVFDQAERRLRLERAGEPTAAHSSATTRRCPATATAVTSTARRCRTRTSARSSNT